MKIFHPPLAALSLLLLLTLASCSSGEHTASVPIPHLPDASQLDPIRNEAAKKKWDMQASVLESGDYAELDRLRRQAEVEENPFILETTALSRFGDSLACTTPEGKSGSGDNFYLPRIEKINQWIAADPNSVFAQCVLAEAWEEYGYDARGTGYANTVTEDGWKLYKARVAQAHAILDTLKDKRNQCAEWYRIMQFIAIDESWTNEDFQSLTDEGLTNFPNSLVLYNSSWRYYLPRWMGSDDLLKEKITEAANKVGGAGGDILYARAAGNLYFSGEDPFDAVHLDWARVSRGMELLCQRFPYSLYAVNLYGKLAYKVEDLPVAQEIYRHIADHRDFSVWYKDESWNKFCDWAK